MNSTVQRWERTKELLHQAMQLDRERRARFLDEACSADAPLRAENARYVDEAVQARDQRDQLALSLTNAAAKQKVSTAKRTAKSTAAPRKSSGPVGKSPRTKKL